jgi:hypothetical protein
VYGRPKALPKTRSASPVTQRKRSLADLGVQNPSATTITIVVRRDEMACSHRQYGAFPSVSEAMNANVPDLGSEAITVSNVAVTL